MSSSIRSPEKRWRAAWRSSLRAAASSNWASAIGYREDSFPFAAWKTAAHFSSLTCWVWRPSGGILRPSAARRPGSVRGETARAATQARVRVGEVSDAFPIIWREAAISARSSCGWIKVRSPCCLRADPAARVRDDGTRANWRTRRSGAGGRSLAGRPRRERPRADRQKRADRRRARRPSS